MKCAEYITIKLVNKIRPQKTLYCPSNVVSRNRNALIDLFVICVALVLGGLRIVF